MRKRQLIVHLLELGELDDSMPGCDAWAPAFIAKPHRGNGDQIRIGHPPGEPNNNAIVSPTSSKSMPMRHAHAKETGSVALGKTGAIRRNGHV